MIYLLKVDIPELLSDCGEEPLRFCEAIDADRAKKAKSMSGNPLGRAAGIGAGLLVQYALRVYKDDIGRENSIREVSLNDFSLNAPPMSVEYRYGEQGKPYFTDEKLPFFNISHAGGYVALALCDREVGIDIQNRRNGRENDMACRFFSKREGEKVFDDPDKEIFYKLWSRKEALGKCTGDGVRPFLDTDVYDLNAQYLSAYEWYENVIFDGMYLCVCSKR